MCRPCGKGAPWWPSFMAVVDRALSPEFGVPGPISDGVTGSEGGGGRLISVGVVILRL